jgi:hypothetical protein
LQIRFDKRRFANYAKASAHLVADRRKNRLRPKAVFDDIIYTRFSPIALSPIGEPV